MHKFYSFIFHLVAFFVRLSPEELTAKKQMYIGILSMNFKIH